MTLILRVCVMAAALCAVQAWAQPEGAASAPPVTGDVQSLGEKLASQGLPQQGLAACASCHGSHGQGQAASGFPRIAGQSTAYLQRQLQAYAEGSRPHPVMTPIAKALSAPQAAAVAAHYARQGFPGAPPPPRAAPAKPADAAGAPELARGRMLATRGDETLQVQACANCHGPAGAGQPPASPFLAAQHASYLQATLSAWRSGERRTDPSGQMPAIAQRLNEGDVAAVSAYYASLPWVSTAARPARPAALKRTAPGPGRPQGTGTEQGAPLTGGGQGPGGGGATQQPAR